MRYCYIDSVTGRILNNCGKSSCYLCLNRKKRTRSKQLLKAFLHLQNQGYRLIAITIEPLGQPTAINLVLTRCIASWLPIRRVLVRKLHPIGYYFQAEFKTAITHESKDLLSPHCHGVMALPYVSTTHDIDQHSKINDHTIHIQPIYNLKKWINYTLKQLTYPNPFPNSRVKLFTKSRGLY